MARGRETVTRAPRSCRRFHPLLCVLGMSRLLFFSFFFLVLFFRRLWFLIMALAVKWIKIALSFFRVFFFLFCF